MILKEMMPGSINSGKLDFFPSVVNNSMSVLKSSHTSFSDILDSKVSRLPGKSGVKNECHGYMTYRKAAKKNAGVNISSAAVKKTAGRISSQNEENDERQRKTRPANNHTSLFMYTAAGILGLEAGELRKLLDEAGISADSFAIMENAEENISKLSEYFGLDNEQKDTLLNVLEITAEMTESTELLFSESDAGGAVAGVQMPSEIDSNGNISQSALMLKNIIAGNSAEINVDNMGEYPVSTVTELKDNSESVSGNLGIKLKERLSVLKEKLDTDRSAVLEEAAMLIKLRLGEAMSVNPEEDAFSRTVTVNAEHEENTAVEANEDKQDTKPDEKPENMEDGNYQESGSESFQTTLQTEQPQMQGSQGVLSAMWSENADFAKADSVNFEAAVAYKNVAAEYDEIISQVIEKAKVIMSADKSEMVMELKPESLGKLSLKVVTENNIVTAKFLADNHQVKQVLEANMQILRNSLEKQGLSLQGFSVSVRHDSDRQADRRYKKNEGYALTPARTAYREQAAEAINYVYGGEGVRNPYSLDSGTINLTA